MMFHVRFLNFGSPLPPIGTQVFRTNEEKNLSSLFPRGLPRPPNPIHVDTSFRALCYIPGMLVRATEFELHRWCGSDGT